MPCVWEFKGQGLIPLPISVHLLLGNLQDARAAQGYWQSIIKQNDEHQNENYTYRLKLLKRNVRQAVRCGLLPLLLVISCVSAPPPSAGTCPVNRFTCTPEVQAPQRLLPTM